MAVFTEAQWNSAFEEVKNQFKLADILPEQEESIREFFKEKNIFVNLPTGFGKSLIFQCLPIVADVLHSKPRGSSVIVVISPLRSLMDDQVMYLNNLCIPAIAITDEEDPEIIQQVLNGNYIVVFGSPECLLSTTTWRGIFSCESFREMLVGVAIDEAHCITQWGLSTGKKVPFRKWYGCLGEMRSLIPKQCQIMILTATATKATKQQILATLQLSLDDVQMIEKSPDRPNLSYVAQYLDKNEPIEAAFSSLICEVKSKNVATPRTMIYCQTRKQCSVLFRLFEIFLGKDMIHGKSSPQNRIVEMFHAGTPSSVKEHILKNMAKDDGHIRILISTVAFGMGVNCKMVRRIVHFGPSKSVELYIQECGRAGRDGLPSTCVLLFNGLLSAHCEKEMKQYFQIEECRRKWLMYHFGVYDIASQFLTLHECCDICASQCTCGNDNCGKFWSPSQYSTNLIKMSLINNDSKRTVIRTVTEDDKECLRKKLIEYHQDLIKQMNINKMVTCPNHILEFNNFHINQVIESCHKLFTMEDILSSVEIWRHQYAVGILKQISDVFGDIDMEMATIEADESGPDYSIISDWDQIRDDSTLVGMMDSQDLSGIVSFMDTCNNESSISLYNTDMSE